MFRIKSFVLIVAILAVIVPPAAVSGQAQPTRPAVTQTAREPEYVEQPGIRSKVFEIKYRQPTSLYMALRGLISGARGANMIPSEEYKILTVRDFPENIATVEEAIKRLDVPEATPTSVELKIHALIATNGEPSGSPLPADLNDVVKQLQNTLAFKNYSLFTTAIQRVSDTTRGTGGSGTSTAFSRSPSVPIADKYEYHLNSISITPAASGPVMIYIRGFRFGLTQMGFGDASILTDLPLREGEKVVVGTASVQDKALIIVLSAKIIK